VLSLLWGRHRSPLLLAILIIMSLTVSTYVTSYMTTYALTTLGMPAAKAMFASIANGAVMTAGALLGGRLSDRFGRKAIMILPRIALAIVVLPAFLLLLAVTTTGVLVFVTALLTLLSVLSSAAAMTALTEVFPNEVRSSGVAISYALSVTLFGGTTQFIIAWLIGITGSRVSPAYYVIFTSVISLWAMFKLPQPSTRGLSRPLHG
jgi:MFS family permease